MDIIVYEGYIFIECWFIYVIIGHKLKSLAFLFWKSVYVINTL